MKKIKLKKFIDKKVKWILHYGDPQDKFYTNENTKLYEVFDNCPKEIKKFAKRKFKFFTISMIKQTPGNCIPLHCDKYYYFKEKFNIQENIIRYNIFLQDWLPGHYLEYNYKPIVKWKQGNFFILKPHVPHRSANFGIANKYTCQITGVLK